MVASAVQASMQQGLGWDGGALGRSTNHTWPGMLLISPRKSSHWLTADDRSSAQLQGLPGNFS